MTINIIPVPALKDNYIWLITHEASAQCLIVDPGEAKPVLTTLQSLALQPIAILITHHHPDHTNGAVELAKKYTIPVFGPANEPITAMTNPLADGDTAAFKTMGVSFTTLLINGHTRGHIAYYGHSRVFCGDTLFTGGCGRVFEGTMQEIYTALQRLATLPDETQVYCGHEYTLANLTFALAVEPENIALQQRMQDTRRLRERNLPTVPSTIAIEKATNPFLRCHHNNVREAAQKHCGIFLATSEEVFRVLREWKNDFTS